MVGEVHLKIKFRGIECVRSASSASVIYSDGVGAKCGNFTHSNDDKSAKYATTESGGPATALKSEARQTDASLIIIISSSSSSLQERKCEVCGAKVIRRKI